MPDPNLNILWSRIILGACARAGVRDLVLCPGSRSGPLVIAAASMREMTTRVLYDERSAAYFALGLSAGGERPAAVVCTSGTAAANFLPAVVEASLAHRPLVVITADRPPELRHSGAPQTIDQARLYGGFVRAFEDLPLPASDLGALRALDSRVAAACASAAGARPGPVHLNVPFEEPLAPIPVDERRIAELASAFEDEVAPAAPTAAEAPPGSENDATEQTCAELRGCGRGWIVAGPEAASGGGAAAILRLARQLGWPLFADAASGLRVPLADACACAHADLFLRADPLAEDAPEIVLRIGGLPTSKIVNEALVRHRPRVVSVQPDADRRDPDGVVGRTLVGRASAICDAMARQIPSPPPNAAAWLARYLRADAAAERAIAQGPIPREAAAVRAAVASMAGRASLFLSSSMPIRWAEAYLPLAPGAAAAYANRGANGIDGVTSTALGVAVARRTPLLLITGDLAFLHDLNGLHAARETVEPVAVLLLQNNGGGIFSYLPIARYGEVCEPYFAAPHDRDAGAAGGLFGFEHARAEGAGEAAEAVDRIFREGGRCIVEVRCDRGEEAQAHRDAIARITRAVTEAISR